jgi:hypothetical protein
MKIVMKKWRRSGNNETASSYENNLQENQRNNHIGWRGSDRAGALKARRVRFEKSANVKYIIK